MIPLRFEPPLVTKKTPIHQGPRPDQKPAAPRASRDQPLSQRSRRPTPQSNDLRHMNEIRDRGVLFDDSRPWQPGPRLIQRARPCHDTRQTTHKTQTTAGLRENWLSFRLNKIGGKQSRQGDSSKKNAFLTSPSASAMTKQSPGREPSVILRVKARTGIWLPDSTMSRVETASVSRRRSSDQSRRINLQPFSDGTPGQSCHTIGSTAAGLAAIWKSHRFSGSASGSQPGSLPPSNGPESCASSAASATPASSEASSEPSPRCAASVAGEAPPSLGASTIDASVQAKASSAAAATRACSLKLTTSDLQWQI